MFAIEKQNAFVAKENVNYCTATIEMITIQKLIFVNRMIGKSRDGDRIDDFRDISSRKKAEMRCRVER